MEIDKVPVSDKIMDVKVYNGFRFPSTFIGNVVNHLKNLNSMVCREDDVFLLAYPKSGAHFLREVINMIQKGKAEYINSEETDAPVGTMTMEDINKMKSPRLLYQHMPFEYLPSSYRNRRGKVIAVLRNPKDACASFYHFFQRVACKIEWKEYFRLFMDGKFPYGSWFDWVNTWDRTILENPDYPLLTVLYEDMKGDLKGQIRKISNFLEITCSDDLVSEIAKKCEFSSMKENKSKTIPDNVKKLSLDGKDPFFRTGVVGDWKNLFTIAENEEMDSVYDREMKNININLGTYKVC